jgi:hypothetical protein
LCSLGPWGHGESVAPRRGRKGASDGLFCLQSRPCGGTPLVCSSHLKQPDSPLTVPTTRPHTRAATRPVLGRCVERLGHLKQWHKSQLGPIPIKSRRRCR